jgi:hypothetical protein
VPFKFTGKLTKLTLTIKRPTLTPEDEKKSSDAARQAADQPLAGSSNSPPSKP